MTFVFYLSKRYMNFNNFDISVTLIWLFYSYWRLHSKCLWFCCAEYFSSRYFWIFGLKVLGTIFGILQKETNLFQTQLFPFLQKSIDSWHWLHAPNTLSRSLVQEHHRLMLNFVRVTMHCGCHHNTAYCGALKSIFSPPYLGNK